MLGWFRGDRATRVWIGVIVLFIVSFAQSCSELKSSIWGKSATAEIRSVAPTTYENRVALAFEFTDETGKSHWVKKSIRSSLGPFAPGQKVEVVYFSSIPERARLAAERSLIWPLVFFGMVGFAVVWSFVTYRQLQRGDFSAVR